ncbi:hypothetical protein [Brachybacterium sp. Z12]|uniref:hypothetical protein n=1 Tax=Brachybacterium sp. Z12 TaxID=2759167 RepID=UPI00223AF875|nr:hypothetical protein [Brachybacterium sp. Z12]
MELRSNFSGLQQRSSSTSVGVAESVSVGEALSVSTGDVLAVEDVAESPLEPVGRSTR